jgi:murein DD-endopeptidase MepM/ murein hydrolase activator NlpD
VGLCTPVGQGGVIGAAGNTGNSFGAHLHFEVRQGGSNVNPYQIVQ